MRTAKGFTLRQVEEATDNANAYLTQQGKVQKPSPNVLHSLAEVYAVPYESLMEKAGCRPGVAGAGVAEGWLLSRSTI